MKILQKTPWLLISSLILTPTVKSQYIDEVRLGILQHDVRGGLNHAHERGKDINAEILMVKFDNKIMDFILSPRLHFGSSINVRGYTNQFYSGLTWQLPLYQQVFIEASFGGEVHTGNTSHNNKKRALGTRGLFRESVAMGFNINDHHNLSLMLDHSSNAHLARNNPGLTNVGLRYGYKFA